MNTTKNEFLSYEADEGLTANVYYDDDPEHANPRQNENLGTMLCAHPRYNLGDEQIRDADESIQHMIGEGMTVHCSFCEKEIEEEYGDWYHSTDDEMAEELEPMCDGATVVMKGGIILPLYLHDHSGLAMSTSSFSDPWDSGQVGLIYATDAKIAEAGITDPEGAKEILKAEVAEYDKFLRGEVYGYVIEDQDGEELDSCWGYLGDDHLKETLKEQVDYFVTERRNARETEEAMLLLPVTLVE